jgi:hypothetical protein
MNQNMVSEKLGKFLYSLCKTTKTGAIKRAEKKENKSCCTTYIVEVGLAKIAFIPKMNNITREILVVLYRPNFSHNFAAGNRNKPQSV